MEISKGLQEEILTVQNKLKNAIRDHQICVGKLKDDPNNADILGQIQEIHLHIVALGRCQKQVVQRLRKEVEAFKAENANGAKVTIASLLGLNNNNHITNNNETKHERRASVLDTKQSKEDYEEIVRNGDVPSPPSDNTPPKERSASVETVSGEDDVIEVSMDENSNEKEEDSVDKDCRHESLEKLTFLCGLGLITTARYAELQNKRAERKRRSTANPQFVYSSLEAPTKRRRYSYLQSANAPQTRQTTARMNGPSPPPSKNSISKSTSPPTRNVSKSLIPVQKSTTRPNILRNVAESKVYVGKGKSDNSGGHVQLVATNVRPVQTIGSKTVHIPGLPSSLTIERIESDSVVCITCRNPGTLTICESCSASYHLSCHTVSPAPQRMCPKCVESEDGQLQYKKDEELATTSHATGIVRKAGEDAEVYKTARGLYKADATQKKHVFSSSLGIGQLPSSTFLIPISPSSIPVTTINQSEAIPISVCAEQSESNVHYSSIVLNQLPRTSIAYVQSEPQVSYAYQLPVPVSNSQSEKHQSYLIVKKISESGGRINQHSGNQIETQALPAVLKYQLPATSSDNARIQSEVSVTNCPLFVDKQRVSESTGRINKKSANRAVPALNRIVKSEKLSISAEYDLERPIVNGRKLGGKRAKLGVNQLRSSRAMEIMLPNYDGAESGDQLQITKSSHAEEVASYGGRVKYKPRSGGLLHSLFSSHNKSYIVADRARESRRASSGSLGNDSDHQQQLHRQGQQLGPREQSAEREIRLQCRSLTKFFELVKLEEAHLPAPSRTKLVRKSGLATSENVTYGNENSANKHVRADRLKAAMADDEPPMPSDGSDDDEEPRYSYWKPPRILGRRGLRGNLTRRRSMESRDNGASLQLKSIDAIEDEKVMDDKSPERDASDQKIIDQLKDSNSNASITCDLSETAEAGGAIVPDGGLMVTRRAGSLDDGIGKSENETAAPLRSAQSDLLQLRNEVSVPDDKAETERQDFSSGSRPTSSNSSTSSNDGSASSSDVGASSSSSIESISPEKITADPTECSRQESLDDKCDEERLGINAVSLESMQVLEQFETAMLEADPGNSATC